MPPRRGDRCSRQDASRACPERFAAVAKGRFFRQAFVGWLWLDSAVDPNDPWDICPWCGEELPDLDEEDDPLADLRQADGFDGEDGG